MDPTPNDPTLDQAPILSPGCIAMGSHLPAYPESILCCRSDLSEELI